MWSVAVDFGGGPLSVRQLVMVGRGEHRWWVGGCVLVELLLPSPSDDVVGLLFLLSLCKKLKYETQIGDAVKGDHL
jgi:hypothetical protein